MERPGHLIAIIALLSLIAMFPCVLGATELNDAGARRPTDGRIDIRYQGGILDAEIRNAPIGEVLRELEAQTGARIAQMPPTDPSEQISAVVRTEPLADALRTILRGYSFAIYADAGADAPIVILLSRSPPPASADDALPATTAMALPGQPSPADGPASAGTGVPRSLDEFRPIEALADPEADRGPADDATQAGQAQQHNDAVLRRAMEVLRSPHRHLHAEALDELVGMNDPRASQTLIQTARGEGGTPPEMRVRAAQNLWRHAAAQRFADQTTLAALTQLANDDRAEISNIARQALKDAERVRGGASASAVRR